MKPIALSLTALLLLAACSDKAATSAPAASAAAPAAVAASAISDPTLRQLAEQTEQVRQQLQSRPDGKTVEKLYQQHKQDVDKAVETLSKQHAEILDNFIAEWEQKGDESVPSAKLAAKQKELAAAGLEFWDIGEGMAVIRPVHDYYVKLFGQAADKDLKDFLQLQANDDQENLTNDASLAISWQDLGQRIRAWEEWQQRYPDSVHAKAVQDLLDIYRHGYLIGYDNTPIKEFGDDAPINEETQKEWQRFRQAHPDSPTVKLMDEAERYHLQKLSEDSLSPELKKIVTLYRSAE